MDCIVIGVDLECRDDNDIRIATKHDGKASTKFTVLDVPRESLSVKTPAGHSALAIRLSEAPPISVPIALVQNMHAQTVTEPKSPKHALKAPDAAEWVAAMKLEVDTLNKKGTFEFVDKIPANRKALACIFKLKVKWNKDGTLDKRKARLVVLGNYQTFGVDFHDTFAATS